MAPFVPPSAPSAVTRLAGRPARSRLAGRAAHGRPFAARSAVPGLLGPMLAALLLGGCFVETEIPEDALLTCFADDHCPDGWTCDMAAGLCLPPGRESPVDPELADARFGLCGALWDGAQPCPEVMAEVLGDGAMVFGLPRDGFVHLCATRMLADTTVDDVGDLTGGASLIPYFTCEELAGFLCDPFTEAGFDPPGCG